MKLIAKMTILKDLTASGSMDAGGATGFFSNMLSGFFGGGRACGGRVIAGSSYLVGECRARTFQREPFRLDRFRRRRPRCAGDRQQQFFGAE